MAVEFHVDLVIGSQPVLRAWLEMATKPRIHVKVDTGLARQGFDPCDYQWLVDVLRPFKAFVVAISTHFANVEDICDLTYPNKQLARLISVLNFFNERGFALPGHCASSASTLLLPESQLFLSRVGISLYGMWPSELTRESFILGGAPSLQLEPVLSWYTRVTTIRIIAAGQYVGYGCTYRASETMKIGVISIGYFEGYPRNCEAYKSYVLVKGKRCQIIGRICMNMMMINLSKVAEVEVGEKVTLIGHDGEQSISADDLATWCQTINYEILTRINARIPRILID